MKVKILGAGSIGNHLCNACRIVGWDVTMIDASEEALQRMREEIYPKRYGEWDEAIKQFNLENGPKGGFDVIFIGTPPEYHLSLATRVLKEEAPKLLQIEKPLCTPLLDGIGDFMKEVKAHPETAIIVGFNHIVAENTMKTEEMMKDEDLGKFVSLDAEVRSHWRGIFGAHPWLDGPKDTYLGFWERGGGAGGEHIHAINLWQHFAHVGGAGKVKEVNAMFDIVEKNGAKYDQFCFINLLTENGITGRVAQDVVKYPKTKNAHLQYEEGYIEWHNDLDKTTDEVHLQVGKEEKQVTTITKDRKEEFGREIEHIKDIVEGKIKVSDSPMCLERGLDSMLVLAAAYKSHLEKRTVEVDYSIYD